MANVVLKNAQGEEITYEGVSSVTLKDTNSDNVVFEDTASLMEGGY